MKKTRIKHIFMILGILMLSRSSWQQIPKYYKSMISVSSFNCLYYVLCKRHLLWEFAPTGFSLGFVRFIHIVLITPLLVLTFLAKFPDSPVRQIGYTLNWIVMGCAVEYFAYKQKLIYYSHGWNIFWSGLMYGLMFIHGYLMTKKPLFTVLMSLCSTVLFAIKFKVPMRRKHISRKFDWLFNIYYHTFLIGLFNRMKRT